MEAIKVIGARIHNLKNMSLTIPKQQLVVITGISGSGKSSLAFDIIFEEGKNQYLSSIGILSGLDNEDRFEKLEGIGPTVAVHQNTVRQNNPLSTVGTKTGILNQLALIFASDGKTSNNHQGPLSLSHFLYTTAEGMCLSCQGRGDYYEIHLEQLLPNKASTLIEVYEQLKVTAGFLRLLKKRYGSYFETPFWQLPEEIRDEVVYGTYENGKQSYCIERIISHAYEKGDDVEAVYQKIICPDCHGERVCEEARENLFYGKGIGELGQMTLTTLSRFLEEIPEEKLSQFSKNVLKNIREKLKQLIQFRLGHLKLYREMSSLSGGELQRLFLYTHLESEMDSLIYVFDEPMAGLHPSEKQSVIEGVKRLRDIGNTVIVVEHDKEVISQADQIIEIGPKAGSEAGKVVYQGDYKGYQKANTLLSQYLTGESVLKRTNIKSTLEKEAYLLLEHGNAHNLKDVTVTIPLHKIVGIAGLSGSGKSSLIEETLLRRLASSKKQGYGVGISGVEHISGVTKIAQEPIGRSANSTPASYIGIWDKIRELFANESDAKAKKMSAGHFSFHSKGACTVCNGSGYERIFLTANFSVDKVCPNCQGKRFNEESLAIQYRGKTIAEVLAMSVTEATHFFRDQNSIIKPLAILEQIGMGYMTLGQPTASLSGGEAQRVKLAKELGKQSGGNRLYVLDEPTTGLSMYDVALLLKLLEELVANGNSVIVIEHHIEVLKNCDYIIELGPEGGEMGGEIIATGTPKSLIENPYSKTGRYLA